MSTSASADDIGGSRASVASAASAASAASGSSSVAAADIPMPHGWDMAMDFDGKVYYIDHQNKKTTWIDPRDRFTKPQSFADCVGDELPVGWEESNDQIIGRYYINHFIQSTQLEDPRQEWKSIQEHMLHEYLTSAQEVLVAKREIFDVKQQRLQLAQDEFKLLNALAASRNSLCSSSTSISMRHDPEVLKADVSLAKDRVFQLKRELMQITSDISYTQRGVDTLYSVEQKLSAHENGCYNIAEVQAIRDEMMNVQKSLISGGKVKDELMKSLAHIRSELTRQHPTPAEMPTSSNTCTTTTTAAAASQTDLCTDNFYGGGAKFAEMAKTKLQYGEWRKRIKLLQQKLADHVEKIEPGQLESDKDSLLLTQEKEQYLKELRCIPLANKREEDVAQIKEACRKLESDLNQAYEYSNQCIANRLRLHEEKQTLLQQLQDALKSTKMLEERLKSFSSGSTFSISSGSSLGSLSTASSKNSLSTLSFTDIYGDPLQAAATAEQMCPGGTTAVGLGLGMAEITEMQRRAQLRLSQHPSSEVSLSPRSSLSVETPPASPINPLAGAGGGAIPRRPGTSMAAAIAATTSTSSLGYEEPTYENTRAYGFGNIQPQQQQQQQQSTAQLDSAAFDCVRLEERLYELDARQQQPLSPIYEKPAQLQAQAAALALSQSSSASQTRSVSAAVSNESVAGDSGVFEAARAGASSSSSSLVVSDAAQVQIGLRYQQTEAMLHVRLEQARALHALLVPLGSQLYLRVALLPNVTGQTVRTATFADLHRPVFGDMFGMAIPLAQLCTKTLQVQVLSVQGVCEEIVGCALVSLAEFGAEEVAGTVRWYNIISYRCIQGMGGVVSGVMVREESSDEASTIISSQTSTLTRNQDPDELLAIEEQAEYAQCNGRLIGADADEDDEDTSSSSAAAAPADQAVTECTARMLAAYISEVQNLPEESEAEEVEASQPAAPETVDAGTNTECAFPPGGRPRSFHPSTSSSSGHLLGSSACDTIDERVVKRSQTFSPSAAVAKNRYACRLSRSDSDSAMHFGGPHLGGLGGLGAPGAGAEAGAPALGSRAIGLQHGGGMAFQRGAAERRSLRYHHNPHHAAGGKAQKAVGGGSKMLPAIPRTSLDLELDLQAQHTKLETLNDEIQKLKDLKQRLEQAVDTRDGAVAAWAVENEDFQRLVDSVEAAPAPEEVKMQKLLHKTSKEIYKLRRTRLPKGQPDFVSFKEKMAFFTRKGLAVPELPNAPTTSATDAGAGSSTSAAAAAEALDVISAVPAIPVVTVRSVVASAPNYADAVAQLGQVRSTASSGDPTAAAAVQQQQQTEATAKQPEAAASDGVEDESRFDYVVDRKYGVEV